MDNLCISRGHAIYDINLSETKIRDYFGFIEKRNGFKPFLFSMHLLQWMQNITFSFSSPHDAVFYRFLAFAPFSVEEFP
jgi:hypothetical protein